MASVTRAAPLTAATKESFAYKTVRDRLPVILTKVIDTIHRQKHEIATNHGEEGMSDLKQVIHNLSELRYQLATDKPLKPLVTNKPDKELWQVRFQEMQKNGEIPSWFKSSWLDIECFFYRKINEIFENSVCFRERDPFKYQKEQSFMVALPAIAVLADHEKALLENIEKMPDEIVKRTLENLLQISLWGNRCDLSISAGEQSVHTISPLHQVDELKPNIIINDMDFVLKWLFKHRGVDKQKKRVDIILDNAGMELFGDLCLAEFLLSAKFCDYVTLHVKYFPWFVSDTTCTDLSWTLEMLRGSNDPNMRFLGLRWHERLERGEFRVSAHPFWTSSYMYAQMPSKAVDLWSTFNEQRNGELGVLAVFKGDLNYRKLLGDSAWPPTTPFEVALMEFKPMTPFVALRTTKADVVAGMPPGLTEKMNDKSPDWMFNGDYALVQYYGGKS